MGGDVDVDVLSATDSVESNMRSDLERSASDPTSHVAPAHNTPCTAATCTHCCQCHIRRLHNGYGSCVRASGVSYADCECGGVCTAGRCAQWECPGHNRHHRFSLSSSPLAPSQSFNTQDLVDDLADEKQPPSSPRRLHYPARARSSPVRLEHLQEGDAALGAARQQEAAFNRARPALAAQPQIDAQLPSVASIASHRQLHDSIPYALQPLWQQICEPEFERYRQASQTLPAPDTAGMAASLISILQLPAKHLYKQRIPTSIRRMLRKQRYKDNDCM